MQKHTPIYRFAAGTLLSLNTSLATAAPSYIGIQLGGNFDDQTQAFADIEFSIGNRGYINLGMGTSDYELTQNVTLTTDYFNIGYSSPRDGDITLAVNYDYWELRTMQADSYTASIDYYYGDWDFGFHPELHYINVDLPNNPDISVRNTGAGASIGYFFENSYFYGSYYAYTFSGTLPPSTDLTNTSSGLLGSLNQTERERLYRRAFIDNTIRQQISSSLDKKRGTIGLDYYFETTSLGVKYQQGTSVIDNADYKISTLSGSIDLTEHWQFDASVSHTQGSENEFYSGTLSYNW